MLPAMKSCKHAPKQTIALTFGGQKETDVVAGKKMGRDGAQRESEREG